ncbi:MAG: DNA repair protein RecN, partial [Alphaproteobacteria bacterium]|nr:DNA repair protein RecN [Alphaproteobacteria bacterium]
LSIRDVVLIDRLDLQFESGLTALTGETGAGKSILLDSLGLALGARGDQALVRTGAAQAVVTASFDLPPRHALRKRLDEQGLTVEGDLILRRVLGADGRSRAFINDQPAAIGLLRQVASELVEVQGQFEQQGLIDPGTHRPLLDAYAGAALAESAKTAAGAWHAWRDLEAKRGEAANAGERADADEAFLRHALGEIGALDPKTDEEDALAGTRALMMNREKLMQAVSGALGEVSGDKGAEAAIAAARRQLDRAAAQAGGRLDAPVGALERAAAELVDAVAALEALANDNELDPKRLEKIEDRLFALRGLARKHRVEVKALPALREQLAARLAAIEDRAGIVERLTREAAAARAAYLAAADGLSKLRHAAAERLDKAIAAELPPLKLERAKFATAIQRLDEPDWSEHGIDRVRFEATTNPGQAPGPLHKIASGGELSRFMLAFKVVMAREEPLPTLVFDEVDSGIGGATADAVGDRLARLARNVQLLVVTHSPQVAARARHHMRVSKSVGRGAALTRVAALDEAERREEIARMLSGAAVTDEARAAAERLIGDGMQRRKRR